MRDLDILATRVRYIGDSPEEDYVSLQIHGVRMPLTPADVEALHNPSPITALQEVGQTRVYCGDDGRCAIVNRGGYFWITEQERHDLLAAIASAPVVEVHGDTLEADLAEQHLSAGKPPMVIDVLATVDASPLQTHRDTEFVLVANGVHMYSHRSPEHVAAAIQYAVNMLPDDDSWVDGAGLYSREGNLISCSLGYFEFSLDETEARRLIDDLQDLSVLLPERDVVNGTDRDRVGERQPEIGILDQQRTGWERTGF